MSANRIAIALAGPIVGAVAINAWLAAARRWRPPAAPPETVPRGGPGGEALYVGAVTPDRPIETIHAE